MLDLALLALALAILVVLCGTGWFVGRCAAKAHRDEMINREDW